MQYTFIYVNGPLQPLARNVPLFFFILRTIVRYISFNEYPSVSIFRKLFSTFKRQKIIDIHLYLFLDNYFQEIENFW